MKAIHELTIKSKCPHGADDEYAMTVITHRLLTVEDILRYVEKETQKPIYQETLTQTLAVALRATVKTVGVHSGVTTTVVCKP